MTPTISISPAELARFQKQMKSYNEKQTRFIKDMIKRSIMTMASEAHKNAPNTFGVLQSSIRWVMGESGLSGRAEANANYSAYVEFGTKSKFSAPPELMGYASQFRSGSIGTFDDLLTAIELWCSEKGIPPEAAYLIAVKLAKHGQKPQPFLYPAFKKEERTFIDKLRRIFK